MECGGEPTWLCNYVKLTVMYETGYSEKTIGDFEINYIVRFKCPKNLDVVSKGISGAGLSE